MKSVFILFSLALFTNVYLVKSAILTELHAFASSSWVGNQELVSASDGTLYGTTYRSGAYGMGSIYKVTTNGIFTTLVSFNGITGTNPNSELAIGSDGNIYGTTQTGSNNGTDGNLFRVTPSGEFSTIASYGIRVEGTNGSFFVYGKWVYVEIFEDIFDYRWVYVATPNNSVDELPQFNWNSAANNHGLVQGRDGKFYGKWSSEIFSLDSSGVRRTVATVSGSNKLMCGLDGSIYGTSLYGGATEDGHFYRVTTNGVVTTIKSFAFPWGYFPEGKVIQDQNGNFYGTTSQGGANAIDGMVYKMTPNGTITTLASFTGSNGADPRVGLAFGKDGNLYGATVSGGTAGSGNIFRVTLNGSPPTVPPYIIFPAIGSTNLVDSTVNFRVLAGGASELVYQWYKDSVLLEDGPRISGSGSRWLVISNLVVSDSGNYSVVVRNAAESITNSNVRLQVEFPPAVIRSLYTFPRGVTPVGGLIVAKDGRFVGATKNGGSHNLGTIFSFKPGGTFQTLASFKGTNGGYPLPGIIQAKDDNFYGMAEWGRTNTSNYLGGSIFKLNSNGVLSVLYSFTKTNEDSCSDGCLPSSGLMEAKDGNFYGTTRMGGEHGPGTIFRITPQGTYTRFASFNWTDGSDPYGKLVQDTDGNFYGTTRYGGFTYGNSYQPGGVGTIYKVDSSGVVTTLVSFPDVGDGGFHPACGLLLASDGTFYGKTTFSSSTAFGSVFRMILTEADWNPPYYPGASIPRYSAIWNYEDTTSELIEGQDGKIYGTTFKDGENNRGMVFSVTDDVSLTVLHSFTGGYDGTHPAGSLVQATDGHFYGLTAGNGNNTNATIFRLTLTDSQMPFIYKSPESATNNPGSNAKFRVIAGGAPPLAYQWRHNGTNILNATDNVLEITDVQGKHAGHYDVVVGNGFGSITSEPPASLTLNTGPSAPRILVPPKSGIVSIGEGFAFSVIASGTTPLKYQWRKSAINISGATASSYTIANVQPSHAGTYSVVVSNSLGQTTSSNAVLTVLVLPSITQQPTNRVANVGSTVSFTIKASGTAPLSYQWRKGIDPIPGATSATFAIANIQTNHAGSYQVVVSNAAGNTHSKSATLTVTVPPSILTHPQSVTNRSGQLASFNVVVTGAAPLRYQWRKGTNNISGATNSIYTIANAQPAHNANNYNVVVKNAYGSKTSSNAVLSVYTCTYALSAASAVFSTNGGSGTVTVTSPGSCPWTVIKTNSWITITSATNGTGNGSFSYSIAPNAGGPRAGVLVVNGKTHAIAQIGVLPTGQFDFTGDHAADLLLQRSNGTLAVWSMNGTNFHGGFLVHQGAPATGWDAFGQGDFNSDGKADLAFQHRTSRKLAVWFMDKTNRVGSVLLRNGTALASGWQAVSAGDFNSDGKPDLLLQNVNGSSAVWLMNGTNYLGAAMLRNGTRAGAGWQYIGAGDFNGDQQTDVVLRHSDGRLAVWHFIGTTYTSASLLKTGGADSSGWRLRGLADFNLDGKTDLLWHNVLNSQTAFWFLNNTSYLGSVPFRKITGWQIVGPK